MIPILLRCTRWFALLLLCLSIQSASAQPREASAWAAAANTQYRVVPNIAYGTASGMETKLDVYMPRQVKEPVPVVVHIHGGGWTGGAKEYEVPSFLPYLEMGLAVVNVEYRLARVALAPAAVEDCRCALRWVFRNAKEYSFDTTRIVVTGLSAGGHLSLTTGMLVPSAGLDRQCTASESLHVAAIVNWFGITDVADLLEGPNMRSYAVNWMGSMPDRMEIARRVSPLTYVRRDLPPVFTIHGDADPVVPYTHAVRLHRELDRLGAPNRLYTVPGGKHGGFTPEEMVAIYDAIREFLGRYGIVRVSR
jgi:acetyl esterase/lipase